MGCGASKEGEDKAIDYSMEWIPSSEFNNFFRTCESVLETAENLRSGLEDSLEEMYDISAVSYLKSPPTLMDAVKVWLWALSANNEGDISKCKPSAQASAPYVDATIPNPNSPPVRELVTFKDSLKNYVQACIEGPTKIPELIEQINGLIEQGNTLKDTATTALSHLGAMEKLKAISNIGKNIMKLTKGVNKLKNIQPLIPEAVKNMQGVVKELPQEVKTTDEKGKAALSKNLTFANQIMQFLHPGQKYTEKEINEMKAQAEKKKKQQEEAKKKKEDLKAKALEVKKKLEETLKK